MKKIIFVIIFFLIVLFACSTSKSSSDKTADSKTDTTETLAEEELKEAKEEEKKEEPKIEKNEEPQYTEYVVSTNGGRLNVRKEPNKSADIITKLENGKTVKVISSENGWAKVSTDSGEGYVSLDYLAQKKDDQKSSTEALDVHLLDGYTKLQSLFLNINSRMSEEEVIELGKKYGMYVYNNRPDNEFVCRFVYISDVESNRYESGSDSYYFDKNDSIEVVFEKQNMFKVYYHIRTQSYNGYYLTVEYSVEGNLVGSHYFILRGVYALDPTKPYPSAKEALDTALSLHN